MSKYLLLTLSILFILSSCTKKRGPKEVCFYISKEKVTVGDTIYLFNCSKNYDNQIWFFSDGTQQTNRNAYYVPTSTGIHTIHLRIGDYFMIDTTGNHKTIEAI
ncbi:MAG: hypothetical protein R2831_10765 [Chitinophagaceae bacterium]